MCLHQNVEACRQHQFTFETIWLVNESCDRSTFALVQNRCVTVKSAPLSSLQSTLMPVLPSAQGKNSVADFCVEMNRIHQSFVAALHSALANVGGSEDKATHTQKTKSFVRADRTADEK